MNDTTYEPTELSSTDHATPDLATEPQVVLTAEHISKAYRRRWRRTENQVLTDANLTIAAGEVVGLVGENGSGKSTLMKIIVGSLESDGGRTNIRGSFGYCPQEPLLYERLTCDEHFELFGEAYGLDRGAVKLSRENIYDVFGFAEYHDMRVEELSAGRGPSSTSVWHSCTIPMSSCSTNRTRASTGTPTCDSGN